VQLSFFVATLLAAHLQELAVPGVRENLAGVAVNTKHTGGLTLSIDVDGVITIKGVGFLGNG